MGGFFFFCLLFVWFGGVVWRSLFVFLSKISDLFFFKLTQVLPPHVRPKENFPTVLPSVVSLVE